MSINNVESNDLQYLDLLEEVDFTPVFILGDHRSGTTLLYKTLTATGCFNFVRAYHIIQYDRILTNYIDRQEEQAIKELEAVFSSLEISDRTIDKMPATPNLPEEYGFILNNVAGDESCITPKNLSVFLQLCRKIQFTSNLDLPLLLKNPWDYTQFVYLKQTFPTARFIFIHRHPLDTVNSKLKALRTLLTSWNSYTALISQKYARVFNNLLLRYFFRLLNSSYFNLGLRRATKQSVASTTYFLANMDSLSNNDYCSIRYEDLCQAPTQTIDKILAFLHLEPQQNLNYESLIQPRFSEWLPEIKRNQAKLRQELQPYLDYHGYSKSDKN